jgi:predicted dehydrogenase
MHLKSGLSGILSVNWSDEAYRKMSTKITIQGKNGKLIADATELKLYLPEAVKGENFEKGWNTLSIGLLQDEVDFYLRGEEYTAQLDHFIGCVKNKSASVHNRFRDAAKTDHAIALIRKSS